jgi:hypothetical protein
VQVEWPGAADSGCPVRRVEVPDTFASWQQYVLTWRNALLEELNLR